MRPALLKVEPHDLASARQRSPETLAHVCLAYSLKARSACTFQSHLRPQFCGHGIFGYQDNSSNKEGNFRLHFTCCHRRPSLLKTIAPS